MANVLRLGFARANSQILDPLRRGSEIADNIEQSFSTWLRRHTARFGLTCFFEEFEVPTLGLIVAKDSARIPGYPQFSIPANHMNMAKFGEKEDIGYKRILGELKRWESEQPAGMVRNVVLEPLAMRTRDCANETCQLSGDGSSMPTIAVLP